MTEALSTLQVLIRGLRRRKEKEIAYLRPCGKADSQGPALESSTFGVLRESIFPDIALDFGDCGFGDWELENPDWMNIGVPVSL